MSEHKGNTQPGSRSNTRHSGLGPERCTRQRVVEVARQEPFPKSLLGTGTWGHRKDNAAHQRPTTSHKGPRTILHTNIRKSIKDRSNGNVGAPNVRGENRHGSRARRHLPQDGLVGALLPSLGAVLRRRVPTILGDGVWGLLVLLPEPDDVPLGLFPLGILPRMRFRSIAEPAPARDNCSQNIVS